MLRHVVLEVQYTRNQYLSYQLEADSSTNQNERKWRLPSYFKHINGRPRVYVTPKNVLSTCCGDVDEELIHAIILTEKPWRYLMLMVTGVEKTPVRSNMPSIYIDEPIAPEDIPPTQTVDWLRL